MGPAPWASLQPYEDQWAFLASLPRMDPEAVSELVREAQESGRILGVRMPVDDNESDEPWLLPPSRRPLPPPIVGRLPESVALCSPMASTSIARACRRKWSRVWTTSGVESRGEPARTLSWNDEMCLAASSQAS